MGELHLEVLVDRMLREFKVDATRGQAPGGLPRDDHAGRSRRSRSATCARPAAAASTATSSSTWSPPGPGGGYEFVDKIAGGIDPQGVHPLGRRRHPGGAEERRAGRLPDGRRAGHAGRRPYHDVDSSEMAFKIAGSHGVQGGGPQGQAGPARADHGGRGRHPRGLHGRRHRRPEQPARQDRGHGAARPSQVIRAQVPLAEMFGYATDLRSRTQGRATYTMQFHSYQEVPESISREIVARVRGE